MHSDLISRRTNLVQNDYILVTELKYYTNLILVLSKFGCELPTNEELLMFSFLCKIFDKVHPVVNNTYAKLKIIFQRG